MIDVLAPGPLATVQDLGRPGHAALGVAPSGAADRVSFRLANRLVGNPESAGAIELTLGGLRARFLVPALIALTGASCEIDVDGRTAAMNAPTHIGAGQELRVGVPSAGLRTYVAVRGGVDVEPVLGSRATDTLSGLGPPRLGRGARLPIGDAAIALPCVGVAPVPELPARPVLRILAGPRDDWLAPDALQVLCSAPYRVSTQSNRVGLRLEGPALPRRSKGELLSEGMVLGSLQVPPDSQPVLFLADHPLTGGYPVIAVVLETDLPLAAQARPGQAIAFQPA